MAIKINNNSYSGFFLNGEAINTIYLNENQVFSKEEPQPSSDPLRDSGYFVIKSIANNPTIIVYTHPQWMSGTISYRKNGEGDWITIPSSGTTNISTQTDDYIEFKGDAVISGTVGRGLFSTNVEKSIEVGGWLMALNKNGEINSSNNMLDGAKLKALFRDCTGTVSAQYLKFPMDATASCYTQMFYFNKNLITPPAVLPATEVYDYSYTQMFYGCTSLVTAPQLPATTLASRCYLYMFNGCTSLVTAPQLPASTLAVNCYGDMFHGCTSLVNPPELPATTLADSCYKDMFDGCTSLVNPPELPATTLASRCYSNMFYGCTKLTTAPDLPATTLINNCYYYMFAGCKALMSLRVGFSTISGSNPLGKWLRNVKTTGVCYCPSNAEYSASDLGLPSTWTLSKTLSPSN